MGQFQSHTKCADETSYFLYSYAPHVIRDVIGQDPTYPGCGLRIGFWYRHVEKG